MTRSASPQPVEHPLRPGASPATIRSFLLPEDRPRFVEAYEAALDEARQTLNLTPVYDVVEDWRRVALVQADPARFRRAVERVAETLAGEPVPSDEPFEVTRARAGL
ncbi:DUF6247 family protein [Actinomycetospora cinnamomea]|uniref:Uncharacterized protein n=1 Tax=Actinomycetospora cinnamomea TaxID=663609 RepID=A0A2U1F1B2_9PSEU|nr:DUF6247 family protein [Actinomycetospora cinnamomea]PVZ05800.1 hypothetical protein C8D89_11454 [Actinomycetospora cinnamomea]